MRPPSIAVLALALLAWAPPASPQAGATWRPDERVLIGPFAHVQAVASDGWSVHAATLGGLLSYDPVGRRWELPLTLEDGYPAAERPTALVAERGQQTLVLGTALGTLWRVDPVGRRFERLASVPGAVQRLVPGELGDLYVLAARGWQRLPAGGLFPEPAGPPPASRQPPDPRLDALRSRIGLDERLRRAPVTGVARGTRPDEYFVGLGGGGLLRVDALTHQIEPLPYGLSSHGVTALLVTADRIWFGGDGTARNGINLAAADPALQQWEWPGAAGDPLPRREINALARHDSATWVAAGDGLFRRHDRSRSWDRFDTRAGLPGSRATVLLPLDSVLWIGTDRGACPWSGGACGAPLLPGTRITALSACSGSLWLGTGRGLVRVPPGGPAELVADAALRSAEIAALGCLADTLVVATPDRVHFGGAGEWRRAPEAGARGRIRSLLVHQGDIWVGADGGIARRGAGAGDWTYYSAPADVPAAPVWALAVAGSHLWAGTPAGAVRLELSAR